MNAVTQTAVAGPVSGVEMFVPLAKPKTSPPNARKVPHGETAIEALAASIQHTGLIQNLVVEPEMKAHGNPTASCFARNRRAVRRVGPCGEAAASLGRCQSEAVAGLSRGWPDLGPVDGLRDHRGP